MTTNRLVLRPLALSDADFMLELLRSPGWLRFIGDRNVHNRADALVYIQRILDMPQAQYWTVFQRDSDTPIGVVTQLQRDYLPHPDLGFAFLPAYAGQGYAYEAAFAFIQTITPNPLLAVTLPDNQRSIQLLERLGFVLQSEIEQQGERLLVFSF